MLLTSCQLIRSSTINAQSTRTTILNPPPLPLHLTTNSLLRSAKTNPLLRNPKPPKLLLGVSRFPPLLPLCLQQALPMCMVFKSKCKITCLISLICKNYIWWEHVLTSSTMGPLLLYLVKTVLSKNQVLSFSSPTNKFRFWSCWRIFNFLWLLKPGYTYIYLYIGLFEYLSEIEHVDGTALTQYNHT